MLFRSDPVENFMGLSDDACMPQAWAAGTPLLLLRAMLGLESDGKRLLIEPAVPQSIGQITLLDIPGPWGRMDAYGRARPNHH